MAIIELCQLPGLPITRVMTRANVSFSTVKTVLFALIDDQLIKVETRPLDFNEKNRETDFYVLTEKGDQVRTDFNELKQRISTSGSP